MTGYYWILCVFPGLIYVVWTAVLYVGIKKQLYRRGRPIKRNEKIFATIIVPARNEAPHIGNLLVALNAQVMPRNRFEVIVVDDHSEDQTAQVVADFAGAHSGLNLTIINAGNHPGNPKKKAIAAAVSMARGDLFITVDADCTMGPHWLSAIMAAFQDETVMLAAGPVRMQPVESFFEAMQALEFLSLVGSGLAMAGWNEPIMANGANLAFTRVAHQRFSSATPLAAVASGDDVEMLIAVKKNDRQSIRFLNDPGCFVNTLPLKNIGTFFQQRIRWASKAKHSYDVWNSLTAGWVFLYQFLIISLVVAGVFFTKLWFAALFLFLLKLIGDFPLLSAIAGFADQKKLMRVYFPLQILYPWYILFTACVGLFGMYKWKGRTFRKQ